MNRLKKAIQKMREYLGKDTAAIALLNDVTKIANEMRNELAQTKEKLTETTASNASALEMLKEAERENTRLQKELKDQKKVHASCVAMLNTSHQKQQQLEQLVDELTTLEGELDEAAAKVSDRHKKRFPLLKDVRGCNAMFKRLRKRMPQCIPPELMRGDQERRGCAATYSYNIHDVVNSYGDLEMLGMFVCAQAMFFGDAHILAEPYYGRATGYLFDEDGTVGNNLMKWLYRYNLRDHPLMAQCPSSLPRPGQPNEWKM